MSVPTEGRDTLLAVELLRLSAILSLAGISSLAGATILLHLTLVRFVSAR